MQALSTAALCAVVPGWWRLVLLPLSLYVLCDTVEHVPHTNVCTPIALWLLTGALRYTSLGTSVVIGTAAAFGYIWYQNHCEHQNQEQGGWKTYVPLPQCAPDGASDAVAAVLNATNYFEVCIAIPCLSKRRSLLVCVVICVLLILWFA